VLPEGYKRGRVKSFGLGPKASFGFITPDGGGTNLFFHASALPQGQGSLAPDQKVIYKVRKGQRGPEAFDVRLED
jgi:CspA family cold shock protein